jgi:hypothetical protein
MAAPTTARFLYHLGAKVYYVVPLDKSTLRRLNLAAITPLSGT